MNPICLFAIAVLDRPSGAIGTDQLRVVLLVVPKVGIRAPCPGLQVEDLSFNAAPARRFSRIQLERDRPRQHRAVGKLPGTLIAQTDLARSRYGQEPFGERPSDQSFELMSYGKTPGTGLPSRVDAKSPLSLRRRGNLCCDEVGGDGTNR